MAHDRVDLLVRIRHSREDPSRLCFTETPCRGWSPECAEEGLGAPQPASECARILWPPRPGPNHHGERQAPLSPSRMMHNTILTTGSSTGRILGWPLFRLSPKHGGRRIPNQNDDGAQTGTMRG